MNHIVSLSSCRYNLLTSGSLLPKWQRLFCFHSLKTMMENVLPPNDVAYCCDDQVDIATSVHRLQQTLLDLNSEEIYNSILLHLNEKMMLLNDVIDTMSRPESSSGILTQTPPENSFSQSLEEKPTKDNHENSTRENVNEQNQLKILQQSFDKLQHELETRRLESIRQMKHLKNLEERVKDLTQYLDTVAPFRKPSSPAMREVISRYQFLWSKLNPIVCDSGGVYPLINWNEMGAGASYFTPLWEKIMNRRHDGYLSFPPIILPIELGGWLIYLSLEWIEGALQMCGNILDDEHNRQCPSLLQLHFLFQFTFHQEIKPIEVDCLIHLCPGEKVPLCLISRLVDIAWNLPKCQMKILPGI